MRARRGFALMVVLWMLVTASLTGLAAMTTARDTVALSANRIDDERAVWRANECFARARAAIDEVLAAAQRDGGALPVWRVLDWRIPAAGLRADGCDARLEAAGSRLDLNAVDERQLRAVFRSLALANPEALADALLDWRDTDDDPRPQGAEYRTYEALQRVPPRNGALADLRELALVIGFEGVGGLQELLGTEPGRLALNAAPIAVLATLPGFTPELLARIALERESGRAILDLLALAASVSSRAADSVMAYYPELVALTTATPDAWILTASGRSGAPPMVATIEGRLVLAGDRAAVVRWRSW
jgi:general secretion pathway protein K